MADLAELREEQADEVEALQSIFGEDTVRVESDTAFELTVLPFDDSDDEPNNVGVILAVKYPARYPEVVPELFVREHLGLHRKHLPELQALAEAEAEENVGDVCVFSVANALKDWLQANNVAEKTMHEEMMARQKKAEIASKRERAEAGGDDEAGAGSKKKDEEEDEEEKERAAFRSKLVEPGTLVTPESFREWKAKFDEERSHMKQSEAEAKAAAAAAHKSPFTGREIFERNVMLGSPQGAAADVENGEMGKEDGEIFYFNEAVYEDDDLPTPSSSEDDGDDDG